MSGNRTTEGIRGCIRSAAVVLGVGATTLGGMVVPAYAGPFTGSISGSWSAPVLSGNTVDAATGTTTPQINPTTATCNLGCVITLPDDPATTVSWGQGAFAIPHSTLTFTGAHFTAQAADTVFTLGTFTYTNGTSDLDSLIFGATLTLTLNDAFGGVIDTKVVPLTINTTNNTGTAAQNADFVQFPATATTLSAASMNVFEGATATFILEGEIIGDPTLGLVDIIIAPGSETSGFVGNGLPAPEPASLALLGFGVVGLAVARRRHGF